MRGDLYSNQVSSSNSKSKKTKKVKDAVLFRAVVFYLWSGECWGSLRSFEGDYGAKIIFITILRYYLLFSLSLMNVSGSDQRLREVCQHCPFTTNETCAYLSLCFKFFSVLIFYAVNMSRYNLHRQELFGVLNNF